MYRNEEVTPHNNTEPGRPELDEEPPGEVVEETIPVLEIPPLRSTRDRRTVDRYLPSGQAIETIVNCLPSATEAMKPRAEPKSYRMAMKMPDAKQWKEACDKEIKNIMDMGVCKIVDRPTNFPVVAGRWHFKLKLNPNGTIHKYKARYVAKGFTQTEGVDFKDTYSPTGRLASL